MRTGNTAATTAIDRGLFNPATIRILTIASGARLSSQFGNMSEPRTHADFSQALVYLGNHRVVALAFPPSIIDD